MSKLGLASRTQARALIVAGRVSVDGVSVTNPATLVVPERVAIAIDGTAARPPPPLTIILHKPRGVVTTRSDPASGVPRIYLVTVEGRVTDEELERAFPSRPQRKKRAPSPK